VLNWVKWCDSDHQFKPKLWDCHFCGHASSKGPEGIRHAANCPYEIVQKEAKRLNPAPAKRRRKS
jgi:hypothetical protein